MRKRHAPIGWSQRSSRLYRFPVPNSVWGCQLKPIEFVILSYLCCCHSHSSNQNPPSTETIARAIHVTVSTVEKYLSALMRKGLVVGGHSLTTEFQDTHSKNFFTLPNEIFLLNLPPSAFVVYAYLLLIEDRRTHTCHPSYNTIAATTGMCRNTVIKSICVLLDKRLITMERTSYFDGDGLKWNGNNLYTLLPIKWATDLFYQQQLCQMGLDTEHRRHQEQRTVLCESRAEL